MSSLIYFLLDLFNFYPKQVHTFPFPEKNIIWSINSMQQCTQQAECNAVMPSLIDCVLNVWAKVAGTMSPTKQERCLMPRQMSQIIFYLLTLPWQGTSLSGMETGANRTTGLKRVVCLAECKVGHVSLSGSQPPTRFRRCNLGPNVQFWKGHSSQQKSDWNLSHKSSSMSITIKPPGS